MAHASSLRQLPSVDAALAWFGERGVRALTTDSRRVQRGDAFIAWPGYATDGRQFVGGALAAGANACLVEAGGIEAFAFDDTERVAVLAELKARTGLLASGFMGRPSERLQVFAVTGTNGKTSTSWWVAQALSALGTRCGVIGTLGVGEPPSPGRASSIAFTGLTTPDPITVQAGFKQFADAGFGACAIEATSIGIAEHRLAGAKLDIALFTNFTLDHLDYHETMDAYWDAKARLFAWPGLKAAVLNIDDARGASLAASLRGLDLWTYSTQRDARLRAERISYVDAGLGFDVVEGSERAAVRTQLIGDYNVANLLAVIGGLRAAGITLADAARVCPTLTPVPGRMDRVPHERGAVPEVVVDYSHTPDALEKALAALQPLARERGGALWCVFGCGGNRDAGKRPLMGAIAQRLAQHVIVTSDNPRLEDPNTIIGQIVAGFDAKAAPPIAIESRAVAIAHAVRHAAPNDVILLAGKGHEDYQDAGGVKHPFSDLEQAAAALARRRSTP
jgi:UDP-N-acetylmuramoyl-L-alanyl-D-glutamate--2,6-diaminopimelate ligase